MDYEIDAQGKRLGRLASEIATVLQGKKSPSYAPHKIGEDRVLVKNVKGITVSGDKMDSKVYHRHTGYMGHLKSKTLREAFEKNPEWVLQEAVRRMLPKNFLNDRRLKNLVFINDHAGKE